MAPLHPSFLEPRALAVFDIETTLDPAAVSVAGFTGSGMPSALQRVNTACLLTAVEKTDGTWSEFNLQTFTQPLQEFDILLELDSALANIAGAGATLVTYNGRAHDLAVLRARGARHWMFGLPGIAAATTMDHIDIMLRQRLGRRDGTPTLRQACAGLGIAAYDTRTSAGPGMQPDVMKCQIDVAATLLLALYEAAMERGSPDVLIAGWDGLSRYLDRLRPRRLHLEQFRNHHLLMAAKKARISAGKLMCGLKLTPSDF